MYRRLLAGFTVCSSFFHLLVLGRPSLIEEHGFDQSPLSFGKDPFSVFLCSVSGRLAVTPPASKPVQHKCSSALAEATPKSEESFKSTAPSWRGFQILVHKKDTTRRKVSEMIYLAAVPWLLGYRVLKAGPWSRLYWLPLNTVLQNENCPLWMALWLPFEELEGLTFYFTDILLH